MNTMLTMITMAGRATLTGKVNSAKLERGHMSIPVGLT